MKLRTSPIWVLAISACLMAGETASAADPTRYDILQKIYGSQFAGSSATAAFWDQKLIADDKYWSSLADDGSVTVAAEVKFSSGNYVLGIQNPTGTNFQAYGAVTGSSTWAGGASGFSNSGVKTYQLNGERDEDGNVVPGQGKFERTGQNPSTPSGTINFTPTSDPWAWNVFKTQTAGFVPDKKISAAGSPYNTYDTWSDYYAANTPTSERYSSTDSPDHMLTYRLDLGDGGIHYIYMWNTTGDLGNFAGNDLVLDVAAVKNPEPTSLALMGLGAAGLFGYRLRRRAAAAKAAVPVS